MVENSTLSNKEEINFANVLKNNTNDFDFISSLNNLLESLHNLLLYIIILNNVRLMRQTVNYH